MDIPSFPIIEFVFDSISHSDQASWIFKNLLIYKSTDSCSIWRLTRFFV